MRKRLPTIVRVLLVLALVASLVAVTAAPVSAQSVTSVTPSPATASSQAGYTANITTTTIIPLGGTITMTFPAGTILPATISKTYLNVAGNGYAVTDAEPTVSGQNVIITIPASGGAVSAGNFNVVISQGAGITNPPVAYIAASNAYIMAVSTSAEGALGTDAYEILPSYTVTTTSGSRTATSTVTGKGWSPNGGITIAGGLEGTATADATGAFTLTGTVPSGTSGGTNNVTIVDGAGQTQASPWVGTVTVPTFTLLPRLIVSPASGNVGATVTALGYDFATTGNISANSVTLGGTAQTHLIYVLTTRDAFGVLDDALVQFTVAATAANTAGGGKTVLMTDGTNSATTTFTLNTPTIAVNPSSGQANAMVTVTGSNFQAADTIPINGLDFAGSNWNTGAITIDASGSWTYSIRVPAAAVSGSNPVDVTTTAGTTAEAAYTVSARTLTLSPTSGPSGTRVTTTGTNMTALGTVAINALTFAAAGWNPTALSIDSLGNLSPATLRVPNSSSTGANTVSATDGTLTATAVFTVTQPTITISPSSGYLGDTISVTGAGWVPGTGGLVTITFNAVTVVVTTPAADGTLTASFALPLTAVSGQLVAATDGYGNSAAAQAFLISPASLSIDPATGPAGTQATVTGVGLQPQTAVSALTIGGGGVIPAGTSVITDTLGGFTVTVLVPGLASGAQTVQATVLGVNYTTFFTISEAEATTATVMSTISTQLVRVWGYAAGAWQMYDPADVIGSDLATLTDGRGYWVKVTEAVTLVYLGKSRALDVGWTLIGW